jgi:hypothetical protein
LTPVHQTIFGVGGNCWAASIASLLDIPLYAVPHFYREFMGNAMSSSGASALSCTQRWLDSRGLHLRKLTRRDASLDVLADENPDVRFGLLTGLSPRSPVQDVTKDGSFLHTVIIDLDALRRLEPYMLHDPHPDATFLSKHATGGPVWCDLEAIDVAKAAAA